MGLRATSIKTYKVEYGDHSGFNYDAETLANIISEFCDDFYNGEDYADTNVIWEIDKDQFADMIESIKAMSEDEFNEKMTEEWQMSTFSDDEPYSKAYVINKFEGFLDDTQENSIYVRIAWL